MHTHQKPLPDGLLVAFEGIDGSGKTTQLQLAQTALAQAGWPVYITRNLGGTPIGEALRTVIKSPAARPATTNLYISVAIQEALAGSIQSQREQGRIILMDRGPISLAAYAIYGDSLDAALGWQYVDDGMAKLRPELTIIYKTEVGTALKRARQTPVPADYFESKPPEFFERVAEGYDAAAKRYAGQAIVIDANQPVQAVHDQTMSAIDACLDKKLKLDSHS